MSPTTPTTETSPAESETSSGTGTTPSASSPTSAVRKRRENAREKGLRLLVQGRLRVTRVEGDLIVAQCRGDSGGVYFLGFDPGKKQWRCTCAARTACSHLHALWLVTATGP